MPRRKHELWTPERITQLENAITIFGQDPKYKLKKDLYEKLAQEFDTSSGNIQWVISTKIRNPKPTEELKKTPKKKVPKKHSAVKAVESVIEENEELQLENHRLKEENKILKGKLKDIEKIINLQRELAAGKTNGMPYSVNPDGTIERR